MKMETPKMDVVRFKEADVLAASPVGPVAQSFVVTGSEDTIIGNAQVGGVNINDFEKIVNQLGLGTDSYFQAGADTTPINVQHLDAAEDTPDLLNGTYVDQGHQEIFTNVTGRLWLRQ
jgi:hypothetical protein